MDEGTGRLAGWTSPPTTTRCGVWGSAATARSRCSSSRPSRLPRWRTPWARRWRRNTLISVVTVLESEDDAVGPGARLVVRPDGDPEGRSGCRSSTRRRSWPLETCSTPNDRRSARSNTASAPSSRCSSHPAAPRVRRRPRRDPPSPHRPRHRVEPDRRRRSPGVPEPAAVPRGGRVRARGSARAGREDRHDRPADAVVVMTHNFLRDKEYLGRCSTPTGLHRHARPVGAHATPADGARPRRASRSPTPTASASTVPPARPRGRRPRGDRPRDRRRDRRRQARAGGRTPEGPARPHPRLSRCPGLKPGSPPRPQPDWRRRLPDHVDHAEPRGRLEPAHEITLEPP